MSNNKNLLAPDVDITQLQVAKVLDETKRYERETLLDTRQNHLTGFVQEA